MNQLPYESSKYDPFKFVFEPKLINYLKGRRVHLPSYRTQPEKWTGVDFGNGETPQKCIEELDAITDFGEFDIRVDLVTYHTGKFTHIIVSETTYDNAVYRYSYKLDEEPTETNGKHFFKQDESDEA